MQAAATPPTGDAVDEAASASSSLIFLGTDCSGALPDVRCLIQPSAPPCAVCSQALSLPPDRNPKYRCNTSLLIDYCHDDGAHKYILIDAGKTFREQVLRWFVHHKVPSVDSIILTHEHADAVLGLADVWVLFQNLVVNNLTFLILETNRLHGVGNARSCHLTFSESLDAIKRICPERALLIGMNHEFEHHRVNHILAEWSHREGIPVQLARDGLRVFIDL
ncbi:unnamed protein product [Alopecurus aequalis]